MSKPIMNIFQGYLRISIGERGSHANPRTSAKYAHVSNEIAVALCY
ncbi:MAG: hypothetical protein QNJ70_32115 [Xenococcaceae cyanobacterium MO_207.B15]|nr:hypothetical protein [Xenococcaceae cyanobacterium MO_207.B15]